LPTAYETSVISKQDAVSKEGIIILQLMKCKVTKLTRLFTSFPCSSVKWFFYLYPYGMGSQRYLLHCDHFWSISHPRLICNHFLFENGCGRKRSWPVLWYFPSICQEGMRKTT
jgi:hypothetical protein